MTEDPQQQIRAKSVAVHGLSAGMARDEREMRDAITTLNVEFGQKGVEAAIVFWCDALIGHMGGHGKDKEPIPLTFARLDTGESGTADTVSAEVVWAGRVLVARQLLDKDQFEGLMTVLYAANVDANAEEYVLTLLSVTSLTLAVHLAEEHGFGESPRGTPERQWPEGWPDPPPGQSWN